MQREKERMQKGKRIRNDSNMQRNKREKGKGKTRGKEAKGGNVQRRFSLHEIHVHGLNLGSKDNFSLDDKKVGCHGQCSRHKWLRIRVCGGIL